MSFSKLVLFGCLACVTGIGGASIWNISQNLVLTVFIFAGISAIILHFLSSKMYGFAVIITLLSMTFGFGVWLQQDAEQKIVQNPLKQWYGKEVIFEGKVVESPQQKTNSWQVVVRPNEISYGDILLTTISSPDLQYADTVQIKGLLEEPAQLEDFDYGAFLAKDGVYATMFQPNIEILERGVYETFPDYVMSIMFRMKERSEQLVVSRIASPGNEIVAAVLLGNKSMLSEGLAEKLNVTGLRHITAISGMHVAILTAMLMSLLLWVGLWRQYAFYITIILIFLFIAFTGFQPSAVRAGIMGGMFLLGQHIGRINVSSRALVFAATGMLIANPLLLTRDIGFQLSFLAVFGIILFLPVFQQLTQFVPRRFSNIRDIVGMTVSAQLFSLPILITNFGLVSLVTVITNILIVPVLPLFMGFGFIFLLSSTIFESVSFLFSIPVSVILLYVLGIINFFSAVSFNAVETENFSLLWLGVLYIPAAYLYLKFRRRHEGVIKF